jgi:hypothetical protein
MVKCKAMFLYARRIAPVLYMLDMLASPHRIMMNDSWAIFILRVIDPIKRVVLAVCNVVQFGSKGLPPITKMCTQVKQCMRIVQASLGRLPKKAVAACKVAPYLIAASPAPLLPHAAFSYVYTHNSCRNIYPLLIILLTILLSHFLQDYS